MSYVTGSRQMKSQDEFCLPGDEGSFVVDSCGQISGLLHGSFVSHCGPEDDYSNAGLMSCMTDIIPSIEKRAAWKNSKGNAKLGVLSLPQEPQGDKIDKERMGDSCDGGIVLD